MPRTLSETEFDAIKSKILDAAPSGLKEDEFNRYVGPAMAQAIGEAENSSEPLDGSAISRFASGAWKNLNPMALGSAIMHPIDTAGAIVQSHLSEAEKSRQAFKEGRYSEALGHAVATALPVVGPAAANAGERIGSGDVAGGLGEGAALMSPMAAKAARVPIGEATAAVGRSSEAIADSAPVRRIGTWGAAGAAASGRLLPAAGMATAPFALKYGGQALEKVGNMIAGDAGEAATSAAPAQVLSDAERARLVKQNYSPEMIAKLERQLAEPPLPAPVSQAKSIVQAASEVDKAVKASKIKVTLAEYLEASKQVSQGVSPETALENAKRAGDLARMLGSPSDAAVADVVAAKNARTAK